MKATKPVKTFRAGQIEAAVWPRAGEKGAFYSIEVTRSVKQEDGTYKSYTGFTPGQAFTAAGLQQAAASWAIENPPSGLGAEEAENQDETA